MKNLFDQHIKDTISENIGDIHASDELKARVLARINASTSEESSDNTRLTAIVPDYVISGTSPKRKSHISWITTTLIAAALLLVTSTSLGIWNNHNKKSINPEEIMATSSIQSSGNTSEIIARESASPVMLAEEKPEVRIAPVRENPEERYQRNNTGMSYNNRARRV